MVSARGERERQEEGLLQLVEDTFVFEGTVGDDQTGMEQVSVSRAARFGVLDRYGTLVGLTLGVVDDDGGVEVTGRRPDVDATSEGSFSLEVRSWAMFVLRAPEPTRS